MQNTMGLPLQVISGVHVFDCRAPEDAPSVKAPWGETLYGAERAAVSIGLRKGWCGDDVHPVSVSGCCDTRRFPDEYARMVARAVELYKDCEREYLDALNGPRPPEGEGGSIYYKPVCVAICNYGSAVIADRTQSATRAFR